MLKQKFQLCFRKTVKGVLLRESGFASLIGLLITMLIAAFLFYIAISSYTKNTASQDPGVSSNPKAVLDKAKDAVNSINKQQLKRMEDFK